ncbi:hypothetical protein [Salinarimonas sp.]|uniref:hypothetical protein n=1 Tax=Salinarimonas sp. TaxID=2766526 RepID=UPI00391DBF5D
MTRPDDHPDPNDPALLLPWYETGRVTQEERERVERWLAQDPQGRAHLDAIAEEGRATRASGEAGPVPSAGSLAAILAETRRMPRRTPSRGLGARLLGAIAGALDALSPPVRGAAFAALALLVLVQAGVLVSNRLDTPEETYRTATAPDARAPAPVLLVAFAPDAPFAEIAGLLDALEARIVDGPRAGGLFALALDGPLDARAVEERLAARPDLVTLVLPGG